MVHDERLFGKANEITFLPSWSQTVAAIDALPSEGFSAPDRVVILKKMIMLIGLKPSYPFANLAVAKLHARIHALTPERPTAPVSGAAPKPASTAPF